MLIMDDEKVRPVLEHQTDRKEIISRIIIPHLDYVKPVCLWGFIGNVKEFKQFLRFQKVYLNAGVIAP